MKTSEQYFDVWANTDLGNDAWVYDEHFKELIKQAQQEAYIQGYKDALKGDDPEYSDGGGS